jgi:sugar phosphate isomerase/epimerase
VKISLLSDAFDSFSLAEVCEWCASHGVTGLELGVEGAYSPAPHISSEAILRDPAARRDVISLLGSYGLRVDGINAGGNPLHPDPAISKAHDQALRDAVHVADELGSGCVVAMSGCPAGPGPSSWPVFAGGAWLPDMEGLWDLQWPVIERYWVAMSEWAAEAAPGVAICLELHPGASIYNPESFKRLKAVTGENIKVNLDPSHFWWQQMDPVAAVGLIGEDVAFVHGKDTKLYPERIAQHGVLDFRWPATADVMPWHFCSVGLGRPVEEWSSFFTALHRHGYGGPISIEHEDPTLSAVDAVEASVRGIEAALELSGLHEPSEVSHA